MVTRVVSAKNRGYGISEPDPSEWEFDDIAWVWDDVKHRCYLAPTFRMVERQSPRRPALPEEGVGVDQMEMGCA